MGHNKISAHEIVNTLPAKDLEQIFKYFGNDKNFGKIDLNIMSGFIDWLEDSKIEEKKIDINDLIYNFRIKSS